MIEIVDQSNSDLYSQHQDLINNFTDYSSKNLDFDKPVKVYFMNDEENAKDPLGKTGFYNPDTMEIKIYVTGRHLKDILRSISHELIHHVQNCRGDFGSLDSTEAGYAQSNDHLRGMEQEAYTQGNIMNFRDFEDNYKRGTKTMSETKINKLKAMVREGVREILSEQTDWFLSSNSSWNDYQRSADPQEALDSLRSAMKHLNWLEGKEQYQQWVDLAKKYLKRFNEIEENYIRQVEQQYPDRRLDMITSFRKNLGRIKTRLIQFEEYLRDSAPSIAQASGSGPKPSGTRKKTRYKFCARPPYRRGCKGSTVAYVQRLLFKALGGQMNEQDSAEEKFSDTFFGEKTEIAVKKFQKRVGLQQTGVVDQETFGKLEAAAKAAAKPAPAPTAPAAATAATRGPAAAPAATRGPAAAPAASGSEPKYAGVRPGSRLEKMLDRTEDQRGKPENERLTFNNNRVWRSQIGNSNYGPGSPKEKLAKVIKAALLQKGYLEKPYNPNLLEESLTIEQKKLNEAKSLFERLKKVL